MHLVFFKCSLEFMEHTGFFNKLKAFVGEFRIEGQDHEDIRAKRVSISFYTDKVKIEEGQSRQVVLTCRRTSDEGFDFFHIEPAYKP